MDFNRSTQARSWLFDTETLALCRKHRLSMEVSGVNNVSLPESMKSKRPRKFASGFNGQIKNRTSNLLHSLERLLGDDTSHRKRLAADNDLAVPKLSLAEQETILRFHANQICKLVGPTALYPELRRSSKVLSTAIMLFRRFYLSNNVLDFDCRHVATAAALLASKVEPEGRVEVGD